MKKINLLFIATFFGLVACNIKGVKNNEVDTKDTTTVVNEELKGVKDSAYRNENLLVKTPEVNKLEMDNGIVIKWFEKGTGAKLQDYHAYKIMYEVLLEDGTVVDGSKIINRKWVHFLLGFQIQTKGWDIALRELKIGDFAEISIPSELARGKIGIKGLIPPDAKNILKIKVLEEIEPDRIVDGTKVWELATSKKYADQKATENSEIIYDYVVSTPSNPRYVNSHYNGAPYNFHFDDQGIVIGLKKALFGVSKMDRLWVVVPPDQAYGKKGLLDVIKPNEYVLYDLFIGDVQDLK